MLLSCSSRLLSFAIAVFLFSCSTSQADVLVSNLSEPFRNSTPIGNTPPDQYWAAQSFITDNDAWDLVSIQAIMGNAANSPTGLFELRRDNGANEMDLTAGGLLTTFTAPALAGANSVRDFFPTVGVQLNPNTKYWFMTGVTNAGTFEWDYADTGLFTGPGSLAEFGESSDSGATWTYLDSPFFPYYLQVNVGNANVPEPGTVFAMVLCGGFACVAVRRRRPVVSRSE